MLRISVVSACPATKAYTDFDRNPQGKRFLTFVYLMLWYGLGRPVITSEIGNWSVFVLLGWRFVFGIIIKKDGREPASSDAITTLGIIKLLLSYVF